MTATPLTLTHTRIEPSILYFGTPVVLISTLNEDGSANLAPMSSVFWLGWRAVLGLDARSKTTQNMLRRGDCVLNLPCESMASAIDQLALTTGSDPVPAHKRDRRLAIEVRVQRVHVHEQVRMADTSDRIDPDAWRPLIMTFQRLYGLGEQVHPSTLGRIPERLYRSRNTELAR